MTDRMTSCRVVIDSPHKNQKGAKTFQVKIEMSFPGQQSLVVTREPVGDLHAAVMETFDIAKRRIKDQREKMKAN